MSNAKKPTKSEKVNDLLVRFMPKMSIMLPKAMSKERMLQMILTEFAKTPKLMDCTPASIVGAFLTSAQLGLEPGPMGHIYLIPYKDNQKKVLECQLILGYRGMYKLAWNSGIVQNIYSHMVYENEVFEVEYGTNKKMVHIPKFDPDARGKAIGCYTVAKYLNGADDFEFMSHDEIMQIKKMSKGANSKFSPWSGPDVVKEEMYKKTTSKRMFKRLPSSEEDRRIELAATVEDHDAQGMPGFDTLAGIIGEGEPQKKSDALLEKLESTELEQTIEHEPEIAKEDMHPDVQEFFKDDE